jgi:asparagine synthetase B (glutamine-hydrolysing)
MLSGGLDSSLITALAIEAKPELVAFGASYTPDGAWTKDWRPGVWPTGSASTWN